MARVLYCHSKQLETKKTREEKTRYPQLLLTNGFFKQNTAKAAGYVERGTDPLQATLLLCLPNSVEEWKAPPDVFSFAFALLSGEFCHGPKKAQGDREDELALRL